MNVAKEGRAVAELPEYITEIINTAVSQAVAQAVEQTKEAALQTAPPPASTTQSVNYFGVMEKLLYNYPRIKRLLGDKAGYTKVDLQERSKSIVKFGVQQAHKDRETIIEELEQERESEYSKTLKQFKELEGVLQLFREDKRFIIVRMYYFNEQFDGTPRPPDAKAITFEDIAVDTGKDEKTLRRWRRSIVADMSICLFGAQAAMI